MSTLTPEALRAELLSFRQVQETYALFAETLRALLLKLGATLDLHPANGDLMVTSRVKSLESFGGKISRPDKKYARPLGQMTDLCGARLVVPTSVEVERLCALLEKMAGEEERTLEIDWPNSRRGGPQKGEEEVFQYRSVHYVVSFPARGEAELLGVPIPPALRQHRDAAPETVRAIERGELHPAIFRAEVQVRTFLEHCWASEGHDRIYKSADKTPGPLRRQFARVAALLEEVDEGLREVRREVAFYQRQQAAHRDEARIVEDIARYRLLLDTLRAMESTESGVMYPRDAPERNELRFRLARLLAALGKWKEVEEVADADSAGVDGRLALLRGEAAMRSNRLNDAERWFERAIELRPLDPEARCSLGDLAVARDSVNSTTALDAYSAASKLDADHPRVLRGLIERRLVKTENAPGDLVFPLARRGRENALRLAEAGLYLPHAYFDLAVFDTCLVDDSKQPRGSIRTPLASALLWLFLGIDHCLTGEPLLANERSLRHLSEVARAGEAPDNPRTRALWWTAYLASVKREGVTPTQGDLLPRCAVPLARDEAAARRHVTLYAGREVVVLAGTTSGLSAEEAVAQYGEAMTKAFAGFDGVLIHPGTGAGVGALIDTIRAVAPAMSEATYLPTGVGPVASMEPAAAPASGPRREVFRTLSAHFSVYEPLLYVAHLLDAKPSRVRLVGIGGGDVAHFEYLMAATMRWHVGLVRGSGRSAERVANDPHWGECRYIHNLPHDPWALHLFVQPLRDEDLAVACTDDAWREQVARMRRAAAESLRREGEAPAPAFEEIKPGLEGFVEAMAELVHTRYLAGQTQARNKNLPPQLMPWRDLWKDFKESNRNQVRAYPRLLRVLGYRIEPKRENETLIDPFAEPLRHYRAMRNQTPPHSGTELLAAVPEAFIEAARFEHARWSVERMVLLGWRYGRTRDNETRVHDDIVAWDHLTDDKKLYDLDPIDAMPGHLDSLGYKIVKA